MDVKGVNVTPKGGGPRRAAPSTTTEIKDQSQIPIKEFNPIVQKHANRLQAISLLGFEKHGIGTLYIRIASEKEYDVSYIPLGQIQSDPVRDQIHKEKEHGVWFFIVGQKNETYVISRLKRSLFKEDLELITSEPAFAKAFKRDNYVKKGTQDDLKKRIGFTKTKTSSS